MSLPGTPLHFRDWLIARMRAEIETVDYKPHRREGCLEGADLCATVTSLEQLERMLRERHREEQRLIEEFRVVGQGEAIDYWRYHSATAQLEFLHDHMRLVWLPEVDTASSRAVLNLGEYLMQLRREAIAASN